MICSLKLAKLCSKFKSFFARTREIRLWRVLRDQGCNVWRIKLPSGILTPARGQPRKKKIVCSICGCGWFLRTVSLFTGIFFFLCEALILFGQFVIWLSYSTVRRGAVVRWTQSTGAMILCSGLTLMLKPAF